MKKYIKIPQLILLAITTWFASISYTVADPTVTTGLIAFREDKTPWGVKFLVDGEWTYLHDKANPYTLSRIIGRIQDSGVDAVYVDLTNWIGNNIWSASEVELPLVSEELKLRGMELFTMIRAQATNNGQASGYFTSIAEANSHAQQIWDNYAQLPHYYKINGKPALKIFEPKHDEFWTAYDSAPASEKNYLKNFTIITEYPDIDAQNPMGVNDPEATTPRTVDGTKYREVYPHHATQGTMEVWIPYRQKDSGAEWEAKVQWAMQATEICDLGWYDESSDGSCWAISDATDAINGVAQYSRLCNNYPSTDWWVYYNTVQAYCADTFNGVITEAETYGASNNCSVQTDRPDYSGSGFVAIGGNGSWFEVSMQNTIGNGSILVLRYSNGTANNRKCSISYNGITINVDFPTTGSWNIWKTIYLPYQIEPTSTANNLRITAITSAGGPNVDRIEEVFEGPSDAPYEYIAGQNQTVSFDERFDMAWGTRQYRHGYLKNKAGTVTFSNSTFGDPTPAILKSGSITETGFAFAALEGDTINFSDTVDVIYGSNGNYYYMYNVTGNVTFSDATFGDPLPGAPKFGWFSNTRLRPGSTYALKCAHSGFFVSVEGSNRLAAGAPVEQRGWHPGHDWKKWSIEVAEPGYYKIVNVHSGFVLSVEGSDRLAAGAPIEQRGWHPGHDWKKWEMVPLNTGEGTFYLRNKNSGLVLSVEGDRVSAGAPLEQRGWNSTHDWKIFTADFLQ